MSGFTTLTANEVILLATGPATGGLRAFDSATGHDRWTYELDSPALIYPPMVLTHTNVFFSIAGTLEENALVALTLDGAVEWSLDLPTVGTPTLTHDGHLAVMVRRDVFEESELCVFDTSGVEVWCQPAPGVPFSPPTAATGGGVFVAAGETVRRFDAAGDVVSEVYLPSEAWCITADAADRTYISVHSPWDPQGLEGVMAYSASGDLLWYQEAVRPEGCPAVFDDGRVAFVTSDNSLVVVSGSP